MRREIIKLIRGFKPQFGNLNHIRALEIIQKMKGKESLIRKKKIASREIDSEIAELDMQLNGEESHLKFLIESRI